MKTPRRSLLALLLLSPLTLSCLGGSAAKRTYTVLVGTYTDKTDSKGIYAFDFDPQTGKLTLKGLAAEMPNPSWVAVHPNGKWVYATNESGKQSAISAFSLDPSSGKLTLLNQLPAQGEDPCYLSFDKTGKYLFVANYTSGTVAVFPVLDDGKLGAPTSVVKDSGRLGPNKERQEGPHAHWIEPAPDNRNVIVADLGLDAILIYPFDGKTGMFSRDGYDKVHSVSLPAGSGPRHVTFSADQRSVFCISELKSTMTWFLYDPTRAWLNEVTSTATLPKHFVGRNDAAEIAADSFVKRVFASNRGNDTIAVFSFDPARGKLKATGRYPTGGKEPRHFALDPTGQFLLAENQYSNNIVVFRIEPATGALTRISQTDNIPSPVCLTFLPTAAPAP